MVGKGQEALLCVEDVAQMLTDAQDAHILGGSLLEQLAPIQSSLSAHAPHCGTNSFLWPWTVNRLRRSAHTLCEANDQPFVQLPWTAAPAPKSEEAVWAATFRRLEIDAD